MQIDVKPKTNATRGRSSDRRPRARGFEAGQVGRRLKAIPSLSLAINSQIRIYGRTLVARSRYLSANNPYAAAAKDAYVTALVGCGIKPSSLVVSRELKKTIQEAFAIWADEADADNLTDYYGLQHIVASEMFEAGECFARFRPRRATDGLSVPLQIQILPSEMLPTEKNEMLANGRYIECGIEFDAIGRRTAYHFLRQHPGESIMGRGWNRVSNSAETVRVPADEVLHLFKPIRAGQIRGLPHTLAGIVTLAMLDLYDDAELERKRIAALFGAFVVRPKVETEDEDEPHPLGIKQDTNTDGVSDFSLEPGVVVDLTEGQDVKFAEPADVGGNYEAFQLRSLLRAAAGFGVTYADMTGDLRQANYGSIRAGLITFRRKIEMQQHSVMSHQFCRQVWKRWFDAAVLYGAIVGIDVTAYTAKPTDFNRVKHIPPKWEWVDPYKDRQAEKLAVDNGFKARSDVIEAEGYDPEEVDMRIQQDQERQEALGITFGAGTADAAKAEAGDEFEGEDDETLGDDEEESSEDEGDSEEEDTDNGDAVPESSAAYDPDEFEGEEDDDEEDE